MTTFTASVLIACLGLTLVMVGLSLALRSRLPGADSLGGGTRFFLVALRIAIGWHFFIEGAEKLHMAGWSGEGYLRESYGPFRHVFRGLAGDRLVDQLTLPPANKENLAKPQSLPLALEVEIDAYLAAFTNHYGLTAEQITEAKTFRDQAASNLVTWLAASTKSVTKISDFPPPLVLDLTIKERLAELQRLRGEIHFIEEVTLPSKGEESWPQWKKAKGNWSKWRGELQRDLNVELGKYKKALHDKLNSEQRNLSPLPEPVPRPMSSWTMLDWSDAFVKYGLVVVGVGLMIGLLTRTLCVLGGLYLLTFFLAMPPIPGWPEPPRVEGHYLFINKNIIEMLALFALATTRSGRWAGLDGLTQFFRPSAWRRSPSTTLQPAPLPVATVAYVEPGSPQEPCTK